MQWSKSILSRTKNNFSIVKEAMLNCFLEITIKEGSNMFAE
jgi:hypothetical protein